MIEKQLINPYNKLYESEKENYKLNDRLNDINLKEKDFLTAEKKSYAGLFQFLNKYYSLEQTDNVNSENLFFVAANYITAKNKQFPSTIESKIFKGNIANKISVATRNEIKINAYLSNFKIWEIVRNAFANFNYSKVYLNNFNKFKEFDKNFESPILPSNNINKDYYNLFTFAKKENKEELFKNHIKFIMKNSDVNLGIINKTIDDLDFVYNDILNNLNLELNKLQKFEKNAESNDLEKIHKFIKDTTKIIKKIENEKKEYTEFLTNKIKVSKKEEEDISSTKKEFENLMHKYNNLQLVIAQHFAENKSFLGDENYYEDASQTMDYIEKSLNLYKDEKFIDEAVTKFLESDKEDVKVLSLTILNNFNINLTTEQFKKVLNANVPLGLILTELTAYEPKRVIDKYLQCKNMTFEKLKENASEEILSLGKNFCDNKGNDSFMPLFKNYATTLSASETKNKLEKNKIKDFDAGILSFLPNMVAFILQDTLTLIEAIEDKQKEIDSHKTNKNKTTDTPEI